jgi:hypothetical protein
VTKISETAAVAELPLDDERLHEPKPKTVSRDVAIGLRHFNKRREVLLKKRAALTAEIEALDKAILALE